MPSLRAIDGDVEVFWLGEVLSDQLPPETNIFAENPWKMKSFFGMNGPFSGANEMLVLGSVDLIRSIYLPILTYECISKFHQALLIGLEK